MGGEGGKKGSGTVTYRMNKNELKKVHDKGYVIL